MRRLCQGVVTGTNGIVKRIEGTNTFHVIKFEDIPKDPINEICYTSVVCEVRPGRRIRTKQESQYAAPMSTTQGMSAQKQPHLNSSNL